MAGLVVATPVKTSETMAKYSKKAGEKVEEAVHEMKRGQLKTGSGKKVTSRRQAIAIGLSEAREGGAKVPAKKTSAKKSTGSKTTAKKTSKKSAAKKTTAKKGAPKKRSAKKGAARKRTPAKKKGAAKKGSRSAGRKK